MAEHSQPGITDLSSAQLAMVPPSEQDFVGGCRYIEVGDEFLEYFVKLGGLQAQHRVLDIGCGLGRIARPLTAYLHTPGCYEGFDIVPAGIDWCQSAIQSRFPQFRFQLADIYNKLYNPSGQFKSEDYRFPFADGEFDFVFLTSVFTHILPAEIRNYVAEISRVLKPSGIVFATYFLLTDEAESLIGAGNSAEDISIELGACKVRLAQVPEAAVGYELSYIEEMYRQNNLHFTHPMYAGNWCGRSQFTSYQDIVVARKSS